MMLNIIIRATFLVSLSLSICNSYSPTGVSLHTRGLDLKSTAGGLNNRLQYESIPIRCQSRKREMSMNAFSTSGSSTSTSSSSSSVSSSSSDSSEKIKSEKFKFAPFRKIRNTYKQVHDFFEVQLPMLQYLWPKDSLRLRCFLLTSLFFMFIGKWFNVQVPFILQRAIDTASKNSLIPLSDPQRAFKLGKRVMIRCRFNSRVKVRVWVRLMGKFIMLNYLLYCSGLLILLVRIL
jgi:hypothetical protein